jgi:hypothetical protein
MQGPANFVRVSAELGAADGGYDARVVDDSRRGGEPIVVVVLARKMPMVDTDLDEDTKEQGGEPNPNTWATTNYS